MLGRLGRRPAPHLEPREWRRLAAALRQVGIGVGLTDVRDLAVEQFPLSEQAFSLWPAQYGQPVHDVDEPIAVVAWIQNRRGDQLVDGIALAWILKAARIRYVDEHGREGYAWQWVNSVTTIRVAAGRNG